MMTEIISFIPYTAVALYILSLFLPAFRAHVDSRLRKEVYVPNMKTEHIIERVAGSERVYSGFYAFRWGGLGLFMYQFAWLANIFFARALYAFFSKQYEHGLMMSVLAILVALHSFFFKEFSLDSSGSKPVVIDGLGAGFYVWIVSFTLLAVYNTVHLFLLS